MESKGEQLWVVNACKGDSAALEALSAAVQPRVRAYLLRVTLDYTLAEDLTQETLLEMVKSIASLREATLFWPWLYRIAMSKFQSHFRREQVRRTSEQALEDRFSQRLAIEQGREGLARLLKTELSRNVLSAIERLEPRDRAVLTLRCFDEMAYADIADAIDTTESNARVLFYRAKMALKKQLIRQGLKGSSLVMALGFFGSLTEPAGAATAGAAGSGSALVTVSAASVRVPLSTALLAVCGTKAACAAAGVVVAAAGLLTTAGVMTRLHSGASAVPPRQQVRSVHFVAQSRQNTPGATSSLSKGAYEQWYYFPDGVDGPVFYRMQRWDPQQQHRLCAWLQDESANYYWHSGENKVYLNNYRLWSRGLTTIRVRRLPTDELALTAFLDRMEEADPGLLIQRDKRTGMTAQTVDRRFADTAGFTCRYAYNTAGADLSGNPWTDVPVVDERDRMRKRGWGYFSIAGVLDGRVFSGRGRLPYFYEHLPEHWPWLIIELPNGATIIDTKDAAVVRDADGQVRAQYAGGRFFKGLPRPWAGMHTIDCLRRDAAKAQILFTTTQESEFHRTGSSNDYFADALVACTAGSDGGGTAQIHYRVAMKDDLLRSIEIAADNTDDRSLTVTLEFTFHQGLPEMNAFETPALELPKMPIDKDNGALWLIDLARGRLL